jgi:hypothetical protein
VIAVVSFEAMLQFLPGVLPDRHEYAAQRVANQNLRAVLDFVHRDEPYVHHHPSDTFRYHPTLGWTSTPDLRRRIWGYDGFFDIETNSLGFRDRELGRLDSTPRVLVLGDSFIWGLFLDQDELMPQRVEVELRGSGRAVDVYNFGMAGYGNDQELLVLREFGPRVEPSVVVLAFFYSNDFEDNDRSSSRWRGGRAKPYFTLSTGDALELHNVPVPEPGLAKTGLDDEAGKAPRTERSPLGRLARELRQRTVLGNLTRAALRRTPDRPVDRRSDAPDDTRSSRQSRITHAILLEIERETAQLGAELVVVLFPGYGYSAGQRGEYLRAAEFFRRELPGVDLVDLAPAFDRSDRPLHGRLVEHWNADGSQLAAQVIAEHLLRHHSGALHDRTR